MIAVVKVIVLLVVLIVDIRIRKSREKVKAFSLLLLGIVFYFLPLTVHAQILFQELQLTYDDRYEFDCEISDVIQSKDILSYEGNTIIATNCGVAQVLLSDSRCIEVIVSPASISLLLIIGQSNAEGERSLDSLVSTYHKQTILCEEGQVYSTFAPAKEYAYQRIGGFSKSSDGLSINNVDSFIPNSLTDNSSSDEWKRTNNLTTAKEACSKLGIDSSLAYQWNETTGEKVWVINAAEGNSSITSWIPLDTESDNNFWQAVELYKKALEVIQNDKNYILKHRGYFWLQGERDAEMSSSTYSNYFLQMHEALKEQVSMEFAGILAVRVGKKYTCSEDFAMNGPRTAQKELAENTADIYMASDISDSWTSDEAVNTYFINTYSNEKNYKKLNPMKDTKVKMPSTVEEVHNTLHYEQLGYNEIGKDAAKNIVDILYHGKKLETRKLILYTKELKKYYLSIKI